MPRKNYAEQSTNAIERKLSPLFNSLAIDIQKRIARGQAVDAAITAAASAGGIEKKITNIIMAEVDGLIENVTDAKLGPAFRKTWLNHVWHGEDLPLSHRIHDLSRMSEIRETIKVSMRHAKSWTQLSLRLSEQNLQKADLPKHLRELNQAARRVMQGDTTALFEYRKKLAHSIKQVDRLSQRGAPTRSLKAAYQRVIDVSKGASEKALKNAIEWAARDKMRYNADRLARNEMTKAYGQAQYAEVLDDSQVIGMGYDLNAGHPRPDICDFHTKANLYGMKPGQYPLKALPPFPFHVQCICLMYKVFEGTPKPMNDKEAEKFLEKQPLDVQKHMFGVKGQEAFKRSPGTWKKNLRHYEGHKSIHDLREIKIKS